MVENESNRLSPITPDDHAGKLWIVTILSLIYALHVAVARCYIKYSMLGVDDALYGVAVVMHLGQMVAMFIGLGNGLGKKNHITTPEQWAVSSKCLIASTVFFLMTLTFAKCSVLALIRRIIDCRPGKSEPFCIALMAITAIWGVSSSLSFLTNCDPGSVLTVHNLDRCPHQRGRWLSIASLDIVTELLTLALIVQLVWSVNIGHSRKWQVVAAFSFRLPLIALTAVHVAYANKYPLADEPQFAVTKTLMWQQIMVSWSLLSATSPNLKSFMSSFNIGWGFPVAFDETNAYARNSVALQDLELANISCPEVTTSTISSVASISSCGQPCNWRPDVIAHQATVTHECESTSLDNITEEEISRTGSHEIIINKEVTWNVTYENRQC
ncbi:unnamed protein product [Fusarium venenatum]|uniref:Rhodopsin domain-containing protein n=1 Tax=Fusarium venenatum TaxID=56646 RepID=A0A2L2T7B6_9HYPO|nr:uncharacterized protein FVRRES_00215 [Fusarium venenatum]CEI63703.1 unnamed protein product [Fusarium venenatum]